MAVWAASLPGAEIEPFHAEPVETGTGLGVVGFPEPDGAPRSWRSSPTRTPSRRRGYSSG